VRPPSLKSAFHFGLDVAALIDRAYALELVVQASLDYRNADPDASTADHLQRKS
jgi:hypothetical protein